MLNAKVLIETYWNVNIICMLLASHDRAVLIETYWNVNTMNNLTGTNTRTS